MIYSNRIDGWVVVNLINQRNYEFFWLKMQKRYEKVWWFVKICIILPPFFKFM